MRVPATTANIGPGFDCMGKNYADVHFYIVYCIIFESFMTFFLVLSKAWR